MGPHSLDGGPDSNSRCLSLFPDPWAGRWLGRLQRLGGYYYYSPSRGAHRLYHSMPMLLQHPAKTWRRSTRCRGDPLQSADSAVAAAAAVDAASIVAVEHAAAEGEAGRS